MLVLSGCSDFEKIQSNVINNNQRVDNAVSHYKKAKTEGKKLESLVAGVLINKNTALLENENNLKSNSEISNTVKSGLLTIADAIQSYVNKVNDDSKENNKPEEEIKDIRQFVNSVTNIHYFLNDETGVTEQMILVQLPDGFVGSVSIFWLGGAVIDYKTYGLD